MEYIRLGQSGLKVSRLCLGTMNMGTPQWKPWIFDEAQSEPIVRHALEAGVNFIDLADFYSTGVGEEVIRNVGSFLVVELMRQGMSPEDACKEAVRRIIKKKPDTAKNIQVGFLAINKKGEYGAYAIQQGFSFAVCNAEKQDLLVPGKSFY